VRHGHLYHSLQDSHRMYSMSLTGLRSFGTGAGASRSDAPAKSFVWTCSSENVFLTSDDGLMVPSRCVS
jgi:hypothetical protein